MPNKLFEALNLSALTLALVLLFGASYAMAWTAPTAPPPGGTTYAPINTSATGQTKSGALTLGTVTAPTSFTTIGAIGATGDICTTVTGSAQCLSTVMTGGSTLPSTLPTGSQVFTSSGTFVPPAGVTSVKVTMIGGGGSGGTGLSTCGGGGGGAGNYAYSTVSVSPGVSYPVTVAGGGGSSSFNGVNAGPGGTGGNAVIIFGCKPGVGGNGSVAGGTGSSSAGGVGGANTVISGTYGDGGNGGFGGSVSGKSGNAGYVRIDWGDAGKVLMVGVDGSPVWSNNTVSLDTPNEVIVGGQNDAGSGWNGSCPAGQVLTGMGLWSNTLHLQCSYLK